MGKALYRLYRPKRLEEVVGQAHIIATLQHALDSNAISHAYLLTGPRGVGKTSIARILAHAVNNLEYKEDTPAIDIIEIDAASNRRIDEIRDLRSKVHIAPTSAKYKVYIIDEVHMLTREAFNALLKTLEEPPAHVIFILATTEVHKLPETIISRTQRFSFKPIEPSQIVKHLRTIATREKIDISDEALELIAAHGEGSFRDSISLLDQISNTDQAITVDNLRLSLGIAPAATIEELYQATFTGQPKDIIELLQTAIDQGYEPHHLAKQLGQQLRQKLLSQELAQPLIATGLLKQLIEVPASPDPAVFLEVVLLDCNLQLAPSGTSSKQQVVSGKPQTKPESPDQTPKPVDASSEPLLGDLDQAWAATLATVKQQYNTLYSVLRLAKPKLNGEVVELAFQFGFHQKRLNETKNKQLVAKLLSQQLGQPITISCQLQKDLTTPVPLASDTSPLPAIKLDNTTPDHLSTISNIFGGAEVLE